MRTTLNVTLHHQLPSDVLKGDDRRPPRSRRWTTGGGEVG